MRDADGKLLTGRRARALPRIDIHPSACDSSKHVVNPLSISYSVCQRLHTIVKPVSQEAIEVLADSVCAVNMRAATLNCPLAGSVVAPGDTVFRLTDEVTVRSELERLRHDAGCVLTGACIRADDKARGDAQPDRRPYSNCESGGRASRRREQAMGAHGLLH